MKIYVQVMEKGGPCKDELEVKKPGSKEKVLSAPVVPPTNVEKKQTEKEKKKDKAGFKSISVTEKFSYKAKDLYEILMDENRRKGFTQSNARIRKDVNEEYREYVEKDAAKEENPPYADLVGDVYKSPWRNKAFIVYRGVLFGKL